MRLSKSVFLMHWQRLARRFGRKLDDGCLAEAEDYYAFLSHRMTAEAYVVAAQTLWATAKWFPRPSEFLTTGAAKEWRLVLAMAQNGWDREVWAGLGDAAKLATESCGGLSGMGATTNVLKLMEAWMASYERETKAVVEDRYLEDGEEVRLLEPMEGE